MGEDRVLITARMMYDLPGEQLAKLEQAGCDVVYSPYARYATAEEMRGLVQGVDAIIAGMDRIDASVLAAADRLRVVARFGVGYDAIDVEAATQRRVWVTITPGTNEQSVADLALCTLLALARRLVPAVNQTRAGQWNRELGVEVWGKTVGVVGLGRIGRGVAQRARGFSMRVLGYDVVWAEEFATKHEVERCELDTLFTKSDFVTLHVPSTPETRHLVSGRRLGLMKPTAYLINTGRGGLVDEGALADALRAGRPAGAALDVFVHEPPGGDHPLLALPQVLPTPHIAGATQESAQRMALMSVEQVLAVLRGERPEHAVNELTIG